jgi:replication-associated recombination protein RarA
MNLPEKHRPRQWSEVVGQDKVVTALQQLGDTTGLGGNAFWLSGKSGTGKTTIAKLIASEVADDYCIDQLHARELTPALLKDIDRAMCYRGFGSKGGRAWIVDECHLLTDKQVGALLDLTEPIPDHIVWVFTTTTAGQQTFDWLDDAGPLLSRCQRYKLAETGLAQAFAERAREIAVAEGLDGRSISFYLERVKQNRNNLRAVLQEVQQGRMQP